MGNVCSVFTALFNEYLYRPTSSTNIVFFGLDAVGKTSILYRLKVGENMTGNVISTCGFNVEMVYVAKGVLFTIWDIGGGTKIYPLWRHYFPGTQGIVFIVDANNPSRFNEARKELNILLECDEISKVPVLVLANKQDLPGAVAPDQLALKFGLGGFDNERVIVRGSSAVTGEGINEALIELNTMIKQ